MKPSFAIDMFYDGDCPVCRRETGFLKTLDRHSRIRFTGLRSGISGPDAG